MRSDLDDALITRLRTDLARAASQVTAHPATVERALTGSRRRLTRRRHTVTLTLTAFAVVATSVLPFGSTYAGGADHLLLRPDPAASVGTTTDTYGPLLTRASGGDLVADRTYTDAVLRAWRDDQRTSPNHDRGIFDDLRGPARVVWAGSTPSGRAAVVVQQAYLHRHEDLSGDDTDRLRTLIGFVGTDQQGRPRVVADDYAPIGGPAVQAWFVDPGHTVLAALDLGSPVGFGTGPEPGRSPARGRPPAPGERPGSAP